MAISVGLLYRVENEQMIFFSIPKMTFLNKPKN